MKCHLLQVLILRFRMKNVYWCYFCTLATQHSLIAHILKSLRAPIIHSYLIKVLILIIISHIFKHSTKIYSNTKIVKVTCLT